MSSRESAALVLSQLSPIPLSLAMVNQFSRPCQKSGPPGYAIPQQLVLPSLHSLCEDSELTDLTDAEKI